jgi:hypothetical protein
MRGWSRSGDMRKAYHSQYAFQVLCGVKCRGGYFEHFPCESTAALFRLPKTPL